MIPNHEIYDAMLIAAEGRANGDKSATALAASTLSDALRQERDARMRAQIRLENEQDARARSGVDARREAAEQMRALRAAAQAVVDRWDSPAWKDLPHTGEFIARLRAALDGGAPIAQEPVAYLYHDARTPADAHPWLHSTMLVLAADRRPELRGETPLYAAPQPTATPCQPLTDEQIDDAARAPLNALLDFIYEYGTAAEGTDRLARKIARAAIAEFCRVNGITPEGGAA